MCIIKIFFLILQLYPTSATIWRTLAISLQKNIDNMMNNDRGQILIRMKKTLLALAIGLFVWMLPLSAQEWTLVWSDEFNVDGRPDESVWSFEQGFQRNHEDQWYQADNAWQQDGMLIIEARRDDRPNPLYRAGSRQWAAQRQRISYTSSCLHTRGKFDFLYGRMEVSARIPTAGGAWPAIWTLGNGMEWPSCGEIDVMEYYRINNVPHILANAAWGNDRRFDAVWNSRRTPFSHFLGKDADWAQQFHLWRMDWNEQSIRIYLDDELLNEIPLSTTVNGSIGQYVNPFTKPQYILLNLALGGDNGGTIDDTAFPMRYEIDYVRIFKPE